MARVGLAILEQIKKKYFNQGEPVAISRYLDEQLVIFFEVENQEAALRRLVDLLDASGKLKDKEAFYHAILEREKIVSTGIGMGVAIPHAKLEGYDDFFIAIGVQKNKGIDWKALDGSVVRLIFMIGGPDNKQTEYLRILSSLTLAIRNEENRKKLLRATTPQEILEILKPIAS